jgi:putative DNA primase/helicase
MVDAGAAGNLLSKLDGVRKVSGGWAARCPAHDDTNASLSVSIGDGGKLLVHCHAGCATNDVLAKINLKLSDLMGPPDHNGNGNHHRGEIIETYDYVDESNRLLFQVVRKDPKDFYQRRPKDGGGWINKLEDTRRVLYRLPDLLAADKAEPVFIVEGEKDANALRKLGLIATTNVGGASKPGTRSKWRPEYSEMLRGRRVILVPDNDDTGRHHAQQVAGFLHGVAESITVVELPDLPDKGDVSDWIGNGGTAEQLQSMAAATPRWSAAQLLTANSSNGNGRRDKFTVRSMTSAEFDQGCYEIEQIIENILVAREPMVIAGAMKSLKTMIAVAMAMALAIAEKFLGEFYVPRALNVLLISGESGFATLQNAGRRIAESYERKLADVSNLFWSADLPRIGDPDHLDAVREAITRDAIEVLICDPLYFMVPGAEAGNLFVMSGYLRALSEVCEQTGCSLIVVHHIKKNLARPDAAPEISDMSWAGTAEWCRQWLLLWRRQPYEPGTGVHRLMMSVGGSAGHSGAWALDVHEGVGSDRRWEVEVMHPNDARKEARNAVEEAREADRQARKAEQLERDKVAIIAAMRKLPDHQGTKTDIKDRTGRNPNAFNVALAALLESGDIETCDISKNDRTYPGFRLTDDEK